MAVRRMSIKALGNFFSFSCVRWEVGMCMGMVMGKGST
jgi:hypothetical protein